MPATNLTGPFALTFEEIARTVTKALPGAYALGMVDAQGVFRVERVGRSDTNLPGRLGDYVGDYTHFKADYFPSAKAAFEKECRLFHDFKPRDNKLHPDRPDGSNWTCPCCPVFD